MERQVPPIERVNSAKIEEEAQLVTVEHLTVDDPDIYGSCKAVGDVTDAELAEHVEHLIRIGAICDQRVRRSTDLDFVQKQAQQVIGEVERKLGQFERQVAEELGNNFDPDNNDGPMAKIKGVVAEAKKELLEHRDKFCREVDALLSPNNANSATSRLSDVAKNMLDRVTERFDPNLKDSYLSKLTAQINANLDLADENSPLCRLRREIIEPINKLRAELQAADAAADAKAEAEAKAPAHGYCFEDGVEEALGDLAGPFKDVVENVSTQVGGTGKTGDFTVTLDGIDGRIAVEARSRSNVTHPALIKSLTDTKANRGCDLTIYVAERQDQLPRAVGQFNVYDDGVACTVDLLEVAYKWARTWIQLEKRLEAATEQVDVQAIHTQINRMRQTIKRLTQVKGQVTGGRECLDEIERLAVDMVEEVKQALGEIEAALTQ